MLTLSNISKTLGGNKILQDISLSVEDGQIFGFLGPNGAGKTTTIRIILGLYNLDDGTMKFQNRSSIDKNKIGFMLENDGLYNHLSLIENLHLYCNIYSSGIPSSNELDILLKKFDLLYVKDAKVALFSKGMRQKLSFIRATIHNPSLLILDEPFNGLDPEMQSTMRDQLTFLSKDKEVTIFFSTHNLYEVERLCDKIAIIQNGKIIKEESIENIKQEFNFEKLEKIYLKVTGSN